MGYPILPSADTINAEYYKNIKNGKGARKFIWYSGRKKKRVRKYKIHTKIFVSVRNAFFDRYSGHPRKRRAGFLTKRPATDGLISMRAFLRGQTIPDEFFISLYI